MNRPTLSVIVPVYNAEKYIETCAFSLLSQTLSNLELILVNDGSADGSAALCRKIAESDGRVRVIEKENGGVSSARNAGLAAAIGEWIGFVDADDTVEPDAFEYLIDGARRHRADVAQCAVFFDTETESKTICAPELELALDAETAFSDVRFADAFFFGSCSKVFKRETVDGVLFDTDYTIGEDLRFNLDAMRRADRALLLPLAKYHYLQRESSATSAIPSTKSLMSFRNMTIKAEEDFSSLPSFLEYIITERLRAGLDSCSKAVRYSVDGAEGIFNAIRRDIRTRRGFINRSQRFSSKEKLKFRLIADMPWLYRIMLKNKQ